ncbi:alpha/beta hydrolase [Cellulophaga sp. HaHaR_3_176]|nr:alpha/beta hydrolase [Cellulophaga sp. HaHaR_3_176]
MDIVKRNNVKVLGNGSKVIMFAHGFGCDQNMWHFITPSFTDNYKIILFDYVGSGHSDLSAYNIQKYDSLYGYAQDVIDICHELNLHNVVFVGHSVSSIIGTLASLQSPDIFERLIFVSPSPRYINDMNYNGGFSKEDLEGLLEVMSNNYTGWANLLAPMVMQNSERPSLTKELENSFCTSDPFITRQFAKVTFFSDNREDLKKIKIPTLILQCTDDAIAPSNVGAYIHQQITGSTLVKMNAKGHCPHMSHPEETIACIKNFLEQ